MIIRRSSLFSLLILCLFLGACSSGGSSSPEATPITPAPEPAREFRVSGVVSGLENDGNVVISLNSEEQLNIGSNQPFNFATPLIQGSSYDVMIVSQSNGYSCSLDNASGLIGNIDITDVAINCQRISYSLSGQAMGLSANILLELNQLEELVVSQNGSFSFTSRFFYGDDFSVSIKQLPPNHECKLENNSGKFNANVTSLSLQCSSISTAAPQIISIWPREVSAGQEVRVTGSSMHQARLSINGSSITPTYQDATSLVFIAPDLAAGENNLKLSTELGNTTKNILFKEAFEVEEIDLGFSHSCVIDSAKQLYCWGRNARGQLGNGSFNDSDSPVAINTLSKPSKVAAGLDTTVSCAIDENRHVYCWGYNISNLLGTDDVFQSATPLRIPNLENIIDIDVGVGFVCALQQGGKVYCWGKNAYGESGNGTADANILPQPISGNHIAKEIAAGERFACLLDTQGEVFCWGSNNDGQLGQGDLTINELRTPTKVKNLANVSSISAEHQHICALNDEGVYCWGQNAEKQSGLDAELERVAEPNLVASSVGATAVVAGKYNSCAIKEDKRVYCWGGNSFDILGLDAKIVTAKPIVVPGVHNVAEIRLSYTYACALDESRRLSCWGIDLFGVLSRFNAASEITQAVANVDRQSINDISISIENSCRLSSLGKVECLGRNSDGALGDGTTNASSSYQAVSSLNNVSDLMSTTNNTCAISDSQLYCWGSNSYGQLGNGTQIGSLLPIKIEGFDNVSSVSNWGSSLCVINNQKPYCWGSNSRNLLGVESSITSILQPSPLRVLTAVSSLKHRGSFSCAISSGEVYCWGSNASGQLGMGDREIRELPTKVPNLSNSTKLALGLEHACSLLGSGKVYCWGEGAALTEDDAVASAPMEVLGLSNIIDIAAGRFHTCALDQFGAVFCWGLNNFAQANGSESADRLRAPSKNFELPGLNSLVLSEFGSCALDNKGKYYCWGSGLFGLDLPKLPLLK